MALERGRLTPRDGVRARRRSAGNGRHAIAAAGDVFGREHVMQLQRARILAGMVDVACERGAANASVADVVARCGVSRRTFYELFADRHECFLAAFDDALELAAARVPPAFQSSDRWVDKLRAGLIGLLRFIDEEPRLAKLLICESMSAGPAALESRTRVTRQLAAFVNEGRHESKLGAGMPSLQAEGAVGGVLSILQNLLVSGHEESYLRLAGSLTAMLVMPYLGPRAARREIDRSVKTGDTPTVAPRIGSIDPLKHAGLRLTYRTARVLVVLAEHPGASNRQVGDASDIADQGQISKLLSRLARAGLIENAGLGRGLGAANEWRLTSNGRQLAEGIREHITDRRPGGSLGVAAQ